MVSSKELIIKCKIMYFCRHVMLPKEIAKLIPRQRLMSEGEWRKLGVQQSQGWVHYMCHSPGTILYTCTYKMLLLCYFRATYTSVQATHYRSRGSKESQRRVTMIEV